jgi:hypothetical protein
MESAPNCEVKTRVDTDEGLKRDDSFISPLSATIAEETADSHHSVLPNSSSSCKELNT